MSTCSPAQEPRQLVVIWAPSTTGHLAARSGPRTLSLGPTTGSGGSSWSAGPLCKMNRHPVNADRGGADVDIAVHPERPSPLSGEETGSIGYRVRVEVAVIGSRARCNESRRPPRRPTLPLASGPRSPEACLQIARPQCADPFVGDRLAIASCKVLAPRCRVADAYACDGGVNMSPFRCAMRR